MKRNSIVLPAVAIAMALLPAPSVDAQSADGQCSSATYAIDGQLGIARIASARARVNFVMSRQDGRKDCPAAAAACREKAFLVARDVVVTQPSEIVGFVCSSFANARGHETTGWLPTDALEVVPSGAVTPASYAGRWQRTEAVITIKPGRNGRILVDGAATWGAQDRGRAARGAVNTGEIGGTGRFVGETVLVADDDVKSFQAAPDTACAVQMRVVASYLLVRDNGACGGANVSFTGVYVRR
jgi:hypothetical protein